MLQNRLDTWWGMLYLTRCQRSNSTVGLVPSPFRIRDQEKDQNGVLASGWALSLVATCRSRISLSFTARQRGIYSPDGLDPYAFACVGTPSRQRSSESPTGSVGDETGPSHDIFSSVSLFTPPFSLYLPSCTCLDLRHQSSTRDGTGTGTKQDILEIHSR